MFFKRLESFFLGELIEFLNNEDPVMNPLTFNPFNFDDLSVVLLPVDEVSLDALDFNDMVSISLKTKRYFIRKAKG